MTNALFWRILFKALNHLDYAYPCLLLDAQSNLILIQFQISRKVLANFRRQQQLRNDASTFCAPVS